MPGTLNVKHLARQEAHPTSVTRPRGPARPSPGSVQGMQPSGRPQLGYERVAEILRDMILSGELLPGERLPSEGELTARMEISRGTLREALRVLASQKLLTTTRGVKGGTFVAEPSPEDVSEYLSASLGLLSRGRVSVSQLLEVRAMLEVPAAGLAARRRSEADLERLASSIVLVGGEDTPEGARWSANSNFHVLLLRAADNPLLDMITKPVFTVLRERFLRERADASFWRTVADEHAEILEHVRAGRADAASRAMRLHLAALRDTYTRIDVTQVDAGRGEDG